MTNKKALRVLLLASWYPSKAHPTLGNFVQRHAEAIATIHHVDVVFVTPSSEHKKFHLEISKRQNLTEYIGYYPEGSLNPLRRNRAFIKTLRQFPDVKSYDVIHSNVLIPAGDQAAFLKKKTKLPVVLTDHWTGYHRINGVGIREKRLIKRASKFVDVICPVSEHLGRSMKNQGLDGEFKVVANVVDTDLFDKSEHNNDQFTFLHVSSLVDDHKNVSGIIEAFEKLIDSGSNAKLKIIGDGDITPYQALAEHLRIPKNQFSIKGEQPLSVIANEMAQADAFVLNSNYENLPCVLLESLACGVPVITTDVGGITEHINESNGIVISKNSPNELVNALFSMIEKRKNFDSEQLRKYAVDHFSVNAIASAFDKIYHELISKSPR